MNVRLLIYPNDDLKFERRVQSLLAAGVSTPDQLQTELRPEHPHARVTNGVTEPDGRKRWYVYRDGRFMGTTPPTTRNEETRADP